MLHECINVWYTMSETSQLMHGRDVEGIPYPVAQALAHAPTPIVT